MEKQCRMYVFREQIRICNILTNLVVYLIADMRTQVFACLIRARCTVGSHDDVKAD